MAIGEVRVLSHRGTFFTVVRVVKINRKSCRVKMLGYNGPSVRVDKSRLVGLVQMGG